ncbi:uncharacterized protein LOC123988728 [Osmia bicornis bicornis]|uniref:uncharacterized protein LOC123988728 n=1 Tax=Osmia bicornis bicornis TaxID=1437191 RepID=UPI001EAEA2B0|nr:uncharacterized protein LOC123988728 [Osmia bicornis bicornis]
MRPKGPIIQGNLNHSARAQDLLLHHLAEWKIALAVAAETYRVPDRHDWFGHDSGSVAVIGTAFAPPPTLIERWRRFVAVLWCDTAVVGVYCPPSWSLAAFEECLGRVGDVVSCCYPRPALVLGDFNSHAQSWGSPRTDARGEAVLEWAAEFELWLLNRGSVSTCVRARGESIVDLSFATPSAARMVQSWRVVEEAETLSDHRYIRLGFSTPERRPPSGPPPLRWALKRLDRDALMAAALAVTWPEQPVGPVADLGEEVKWFRGTMKAICDVAMPRAKCLPRRAAYWWSGEIADIRQNCNVARRQWQRARRRRNRDPAGEEELYGCYRCISGSSAAGHQGGQVSGMAGAPRLS